MDMKIKNWKLKEVEDNIEIIAEDSIIYRKFILNQLQIPTSDNYSVDRSGTSINWNLISDYYNFFFDYENSEKQVKDFLKDSDISKSEHLIILYGWNEPVIKIPTKIFLNDWEGFIRSTLWETIIFNENFKLIIEVSRDFYMHSNFIIKTEF